MLELPREPGEVQQELRIEPQASYVLSVKNPEASSPPGARLPEQDKADVSADKRRRFHGRRFIDAAPELLDQEGAEFVLVGAGEPLPDDVRRRIGTDPEPDLVEDLRLDRAQHPAAPLFEGAWS